MSKQLRATGKSERQLVLECEVVVNRVIGRCKGKAPAEIRCEMRKSFPFGPEATASEKRIWEKTLDWAMKEVEKWPKAASLAVLALMITGSAAQAYPRMDVEGNTYALRLGPPAVWIKESELHGICDSATGSTLAVVAQEDWHSVTVPASKDAPVKRQSFAMRHPKLHKAGRFIRRTCQILQPIVSFGGSVAQIVTSIK